MRRSGLLLLLLAHGVAACGRRHADEVEPARIAAAADLALAFREAGEVFAKTGHPAPTFSFGSTGLLAKQINEGAPFDVFAAANVEFVDQVVKAGACEGTSQALYARGRIVAFTPKDTKVTPPTALSDLASPQYRFIAIANPEHAPYGRAAQQAFEGAGVWDAVKPKLVYGENVQQTLQFAQTGNADVAIVSLSLAIGTDGTYLAIDPQAHKPIDQALVVCGQRKRTDEGRAFLQFVGSPQGRTILRKYGFLLPGEGMDR